MNDEYTGKTIDETAFSILKDAVTILETYRNTKDTVKFMEYAPKVFGMCAEYFETFNQDCFR